MRQLVGDWPASSHGECVSCLVHLEVSVLCEVSDACTVSWDVCAVTLTSCFWHSETVVHRCMEVDSFTSLPEAMAGRPHPKFIVVFQLMLLHFCHAVFIFSVLRCCVTHQGRCRVMEETNSTKPSKATHSHQSSTSTVASPHLHRPHHSHRAFHRVAPCRTSTNMEDTSLLFLRDE